MYHSVSVSIRWDGTDYYLDVFLAFNASGGGCTGEQLITFTRYLGPTKPTCLSIANGDVPFSQATNASGNDGYADPDAGCTVGSVACSVTF